MLVIEVEFLSGRYVATAHDDRSRAEWPPHPVRLFSALVASLYEGGQDEEARDAARAVLVQLEDAGAPEIEASNVAQDDAVCRRTVNEVYVPVNDPAVLDHGRIEALLDDIAAADTNAAAAASNTDRNKAATQRTKAEEKLHRLVTAHDVDASKAAIDAALSLQPASRVRQKRTFPSVTPDSPVVRFAWTRLALTAPERAVLTDLLGRVTRLGHSSSLVRCALADTAAPTLRPIDEGPADHTLRVTGPGQLRRLDDAFSLHRAVRPRVLPFRAQRYRIVEDQPEAAEAVRSVFDSDDARWIVLRADGSRFQASRGVDLAKALHRALMCRCPTQPPPELITGRGADGRPSDRPHLAVVPLPDVGHEHAHGGVLGVALILPRGVDRGPIVEAIASWEASVDGPSNEPTLTLTLGKRGVLDLRRDEIRDQWALRAWAWCRPSERWVTVTPIALDANPGNLHPRGGDPADRAERARQADERAREIVAAACVRVGLPTPTDVRLSLAPMIAGGLPVRAFDPFPREAGRLRRVRVHAEITFPSIIRGPVLLGAGRYFGLGLCRPIGGRAR